MIKLNTNYDVNAGTISVAPEVVKWRYKGSRNNSTATVDGSKGWWFGMEDSAIIWRGHLIVSDNGGHMMCINLNTLELVWVQDVLDDTNCTAVLELENGHPYGCPSMAAGARIRMQRRPYPYGSWMPKRAA